MATFLKTKDFLVLVRGKMHVGLNRLVRKEFRLNLKSANIPEPRLFRNFKEETAVGPGKENGAEPGGPLPKE